MNKFVSRGELYYNQKCFQRVQILTWGKHFQNLHFQTIFLINRNIPGRQCLSRCKYFLSIAAFWAKIWPQYEKYESCWVCILVYTIISPCCVLQSRQQFYKEDLSHHTLLIISNFLKVIIFPSTPDAAHCSCFPLKTARNNNNSLFPCERYFFGVCTRVNSLLQELLLLLHMRKL